MSERTAGFIARFPARAAREQRRWLVRPSWLRIGPLLPGAVLLVMLACGLFPDWIAPFDPTDMTDAILAPPSLAHWFGTDHFGRDVMSLVIYGARQSLLMGACAVFVGGLLGGLLGLVSGYAG